MGIERSTKGSININEELQFVKKKFAMPHIYVILFVFTTFAAISTYFVPASMYERIPGPEGRTTIDPNSYQYVEQTPVTLKEFMIAIPKGLVALYHLRFLIFELES